MSCFKSICAAFLFLAFAPSTFASEHYAVLLMGGGNAERVSSNTQRDTEVLYRMAEGRGIPKRHISVFLDDGNSPASDHTWSGFHVNAETDLDQDHHSDVKGPLTEVAIRQEFARLSGELRFGDTLTIFLDSHGAIDGAFAEWSPFGSAQKVISAEKLITMLTPLKNSGVIVRVATLQCYGGELVRKLARAGICGVAAQIPETPGYVHDSLTWLVPSWRSYLEMLSDGLKAGKSLIRAHQSAVARQDPDLNNLGYDSYDALIDRYLFSRSINPDHGLGFASLFESSNRSIADFSKLRQVLRDLSGSLTEDQLETLQFKRVKLIRAIAGRDASKLYRQGASHLEPTTVEELNLLDTIDACMAPNL